MATLRLPPGFRFHPTDQELVEFYLKEKVEKRLGPDCVIVDVDLLVHEPWDLPSLSSLDEGEWYFFCPRDRKYPNGSRANRATEKGYWKATGKDKPVLAVARGRRQTGAKPQQIGMKKTLVFYQGRAPHGTRTDWVMHEYRLEADGAPSRLRQGDYVLCRIFNKSAAAADEAPGTPVPTTQTSGARMDESECVTPWEEKGVALRTPGESTVLEDAGSPASPTTDPGTVSGTRFGEGLVVPRMDHDDWTESLGGGSSYQESGAEGLGVTQGVEELFAGVGDLSAEEQQLLEEFFPGNGTSVDAQPDLPEVDTLALEALENARGAEWSAFLEDEGGQLRPPYSAQALALPAGEASQRTNQPLRGLRDPSEEEALHLGLSASWARGGLIDDDVVGSLGGLLEDTGDDEMPSFDEVTQLADELAGELQAAEEQWETAGTLGAVPGGIMAGPAHPPELPAASSSRGRVASSASRRSLEEDLRHVLRAHGVVVDQADLSSPSAGPGNGALRIRPRPRAALPAHESQPSAALSSGASGTAPGLNRIRLQVMAAPRFNLDASAAQGFLPEFQEALALDSAMSRDAALEHMEALPEDLDFADGSEVDTWINEEEPYLIARASDSLAEVRRVVVGGGRAPVSVQRVDRRLEADVQQGRQGPDGRWRPVVTGDVVRQGGDVRGGSGVAAQRRPDLTGVQERTAIAGSRVRFASLAHASAVDRGCAPTRSMPTPTVPPDVAQFADTSRFRKGASPPQSFAHQSARTRPLPEAVEMRRREKSRQLEAQHKGMSPLISGSRGSAARKQPSNQGHVPGGVSKGLIWVLEKLPVLPASAAEMPRRRSENDVAALRQRHPFVPQLAVGKGFKGKEAFASCGKGAPADPLESDGAATTRPLYGPAHGVTVRGLFSSVLHPLSSWGPLDWVIIGAVAGYALHAAGSYLSTWWT